MNRVSGGAGLESLSIIAAALIVAAALLISGRGENDSDEPVKETVTEPGFPAGLPFAPAVRVDDLQQTSVAQVHVFVPVWPV